MALIIDAEMPHSCFDCPCLYREVDGRYFCRHSDGLLYPLYYPMTEGCPILGEIPDKHGDLIDRGLVQEVLAQLLPLVITNELTDKEIGLVHRTVGAIAEMINEQEVVVEATE